MKYRIFNLKASYPEVFAASEADLLAIIASLPDNGGGAYEYEALPPEMQGNSDKLNEDMAFGQALVLDFLTAAKTAGLNLANANALRDLLRDVEYWLNAGSIGVAREAMQAVTPNTLLSADAKAYYLSKIDAYLAQ